MKKSFDDAVSDVMQSIGLLVRRIRAAAQSNELSLTEATVLGRLYREGQATTAELARAENMKPQSMGAAIATLEEEGLVERVPHPTDGRQMYIQLTKTGREWRERRRAEKQGWLTQAIAGLDKHEQAVLFEAAEIVKRMAEQ